VREEPDRADYLTLTNRAGRVFFDEAGAVNGRRARGIRIGADGGNWEARQRIVFSEGCIPRVLEKGALEKPFD